MIPGPAASSAEYERCVSLPSKTHGTFVLSEKYIGENRYPTGHANAADYAATRFVPILTVPL